MSTEPNQDLKLETFVPYQLSVTSNAISALIESQYNREFGLRIPEWRLMAILGEIDHATQSILVELTHMDKVTINRATKSLSDRGLIERSPNHADGRSHLLALSDEGKLLYQKIVPMAKRIESKILDHLEDGETDILMAILAKLKKAVPPV